MSTKRGHVGHDSSKRMSLTIRSLTPCGTWLIQNVGHDSCGTCGTWLIQKNEFDNKEFNSFFLPSETQITYEWVMSHIWMSHVTHMNESCHTYEWVMSHTWMGHVPHMNESCPTWPCWERMENHLHDRCHYRNASHMNESCHTYAWDTTQIWMSHVTHMRETWHKYEWVMSHVECDTDGLFVPQNMFYRICSPTDGRVVPHVCLSHVTCGHIASG